MFCGSAGVLAAALIQGYFGIAMEGDSASLTPRLGRDSARIHVYQPANGRFLAYDYRYATETREMFLTCNSNLMEDGWICLLLPDAKGRDRERLRDGLGLTVDGQPREFQIQVLNEDVSVRFRLERGYHTAKISAAAEPSR
jgi:hypothetical protein